MLLTIAGVVLALWLLGLVLHIAGAFIHALLVIALVIVVFNFIKKRA